MLHYALTIIAALELSEAANLFPVTGITALLFSELKVCVLMWAVFLFSSGKTTLIRSLLLVLTIYKSLGFISATLYYFSGIEIVNTSMVVFTWLAISSWVIFKPQKYPGAFTSSAKDLDRSKVYIAISHGNMSATDVLMSIVGWSATSVSYVVDDMWFVFRKKTSTFSIYPVSRLPNKGKVYVEISIDQMRAVELLTLHVGSKWGIFKKNCVTTPKEFWKEAGIDLKFYEITPGLLVKKLWKKKQI